MILVITNPEEMEVNLFTDVEDTGQDEELVAVFERVQAQMAVARERLLAEMTEAVEEAWFSWTDEEKLEGVLTSDMLSLLPRAPAMTWPDTLMAVMEATYGPADTAYRALIHGLAVLVADHYRTYPEIHETISEVTEVFGSMPEPVAFLADFNSDFAYAAEHQAAVREKAVRTAFLKGYGLEGVDAFVTLLDDGNVEIDGDGILAAVEAMALDPHDLPEGMYDSLLGMKDSGQLEDKEGK